MTFSPKIKLIQDFWIIIEKVKNKKRTFRQKCDILAYILKPRTSQNEPKPVEIRIRIFLLAFIFQTSSPNAEIWVFWAKKFQFSNLLTKFYLHPISKMLISNLALVLKNFEPKSPNMDIMGQKIPTF